MSKEIHLFNRNKLTLKHRFYILMDILVSNQGSGSRMESVLLFSIFYLQFLTGFFSKKLKVYDSENSSSDKIINWIQAIVRVREILAYDPAVYKVAVLALVSVLILYSVFFFVVIVKTNKASFYSYPEMILNLGLKLFIYIFFTAILDLSIGVFCFGETNTSDVNAESICNFNIAIKIVISIFFIYSIIFSFFIQQFYTDSLFLSTTYYSKMACQYEIYMTLHTIIYSLLLIKSPTFGSLLFLIYNIFASLFFIIFYFSSFIFYDPITNNLYGIFFVLYFYLSIFSFVFNYITINEKGLIYCLSSLFFVIIYFNLRAKLENKLLLKTPFFKLNNKYSLLYYFKSLVEKINLMDQSEEDRALIIGIVQMHSKECPIEDCMTKNTNSIYLPLKDQWSEREKPFYQDKVFLLNFVLSIIKFYIHQSLYFPEILINLSLYYLIVIGNYCQSIICYTKVKELKMSLQDHFSFIRLNIAISRKMVETLKEPNESCFNLEDLNVTFYFKYEKLSKTFYSEINKDVNLSLEFWNCFKKKEKEPIDFNYIFKLTDNIRKTKMNVESLWHELYKLYNGVNELFDLYLSYVEIINDDDLQKRHLESIKRKVENSAENIQMNYYNILFNKETGIIIANGDKGKEGIIEKTNKEIETIFSFKMEELKRMNICNLMPKLFAQCHNSFMERFVEIGEKRILDKKDFKTFAKNKDNSIFLIRKSVKLLPMLNRSIFFVAIIVKEKIDDIIFIDSRYNIQGMSSVLMKKLMISNMDLFQENEIPFYVICKKFVNFNRIFLHGKKKNHNVKKKKTKKIENGSLPPSMNQDTMFTKSTTIVNIENISNIHENKLDINLQKDNGKDKDLPNLTINYINGNNNNSIREGKDNKDDDETEDDDLHDNIEIDENIELEYEIKIPQFLHDYSKGLQNACTVSSVKVQEDNSKQQKTPFPFEEFNEEDLLMTEDKRLNMNVFTKRSSLQHSNSNYNLNDTPQMTSMKELSKQMDEKKEFNLKIAKHRQLFEQDRFNELEDFIDVCSKNTALEFKFNFTFDKYKYGDKHMVFVIRCIDNKNEAGNGSDDSEKGVVEDDLLKLKKNKVMSLYPLIELLPQEEDEIKVARENYLAMALENPVFKKSLEKYKEEINKYSRIHGNQKDTVITDDEQGSQASTAGFNENLCKKNRIEEIRANVMKNVSNFQTLTYIKSLVFICLILTAGFIIMYIITLFNIYDDLNMVSDLNINFFQLTCWLSNTVSSLISMRALFKLNQDKLSYKFNSYISDHNKYFEHLRNISLDWNKKIESTYGIIEKQIGDFIPSEKSKFWIPHKVEYTHKDIHDTESLPLSVAQVLTNINTLLRLQEYTAKGGITNVNTLNMIAYTCQMSIENAYNNLFPVLYDRIREIPDLLQEFNKHSMNIFIILIAIYGVLIFIVVVLYALSIHLTNRNMGEGLEKITHISPEKIDETIKKIEQFAQSLVKYFKKDNIYKIEEMNKETPKKVIQDKNSSDGFSSEGRKHKKLKILFKAYVQIIILFSDFLLFLLLIYYYTISMIDKTNQMISLECYYLGKTLIASANTLDIKCRMAECDVNFDNFKFNDLVTQQQFTQMIKMLNVFEEFYDFYSKSYLTDACLAAYDSTTTEYSKCKEDPVIQSANNTEALIQLIDEKVMNIKKEFVLYQDDPKYTRTQSFGGKNFFDIEHAFYNYIITVNDRFSTIMHDSLLIYLDKVRMILIILIVLFCVTIISFMMYIVFYFLRVLINLLSVSRCIMRIIPTIVIFNTQELEAWIENKY